MLLRAPDRQDLFWSRADTAALFLLILGGALLLWGGGAVLARVLPRRWAGVLSHLLFAAAAAGLVQLVPPKAWEGVGLSVDGGYAVLLLAGLGLSGLSAAGFLRGAKAGLRKGFAVWSVLFPLLFLQLITRPSFVAREDLPRAAESPVATGAPSLVLFVFDSVAMAQCLEATGQWRADLPALEALRVESVYFEEAISCGVGTTMSLPNLLFQRDPADYHRNQWADSWFSVDPLTFPNGILHSAKAAGYRTALVGTYLPLGQMYDSLLDGGQEYPFSRFLAPVSFGHRLANQAVCLLAYARGPFNGSAIGGIPRLRHVPGWMSERYFEQTTKQAKAAIEGHLQRMGPSGHFFFAYMAIPHSPAIFLPDGTVDSMRATYDTQLRYADRVLGEYLEEMKARGTYDRSWVIVTSDHGHHGFRLPGKAHRHVPFLVKAPGSRCAQAVGSELPLWQLGPFFRSVFAGQDVEDCLRMLPRPLACPDTAAASEEPGR